MPREADVFEPIAMLTALAEVGVDFVVIGGVAGGSYGSAYGTFDLDIAYTGEPENLEGLLAVPFVRGAKPVDRASKLGFETSLGSLDVHSNPPGAPSYRQLLDRATTITVAGHEVRVASLDDLIAMSEAMGRPRDKLLATEYRVLSDELRAPRGD